MIITDRDTYGEVDIEDSRKNTAIKNIFIKEDKAYAAVGGRRYGWSAFFYKDNNNWKLIFQGQAAPLCSDLEKRGVPKKYQNDVSVE